MNVSLNTSSLAQVCASNSAHPGLLNQSNKGVKYTQPWNRVGYNCKNRLRFCASANALSITSFRDLQVCAWKVAHPGLSDRSNKGVKFTQHWHSQLTTAKTVCANISSNTGARMAILANLSPDSGNLANFESVWLQMFWFGDLANFWRFFDSIWLQIFCLAKFTTCIFARICLYTHI